MLQLRMTTLKQWVKVMAVCAVIAFVFVSAGDAFAAQTSTDFGVSEFEQTTALGSQSLTSTIAQIINVILGLLGIIAVGIILYGGFVYMTSNGEEERITTAKKILINGVIGLVIVLSSWTIARFIITALSDATGSGQVTQEQCATDPALAANDPNCGKQTKERYCLENPFSGACISDTFVVKSITPVTEGTGMSNVRIRVVFSTPIAAVTLEDAVSVEKSGDDITDQFAVSFIDGNRRAIVLENQADTCVDQSCLPAGSYTVMVDESLEDESGRELETTVTIDDMDYSFPLKGGFMVDVDGELIINDGEYGPPISGNDDEFTIEEGTGCETQSESGDIIGSFAPDCDSETVEQWWGEGGNDGIALQLNGDGRHVDFGDVAPGEDGAITIAAWFKKEATSTERQVLLNYGVPNDWVNIEVNDRVMVWDDIDDSNHDVYGPEVTLDEWHHVAYSIAANGVRQLFYDGELIKTVVHETNANDISEPSFIVGVRGTRVAAPQFYPFHGAVDSVRVYRQAVGLSGFVNDEIPPQITDVSVDLYDGSAVGVSELTVPEQHLVQGATYDIKVTSTDSSGLGLLQMTVEGDESGVIMERIDGPRIGDGSDGPYSYREPWYLAANGPKEEYTMTVTVTDIDGNSTTTERVFTVAPSHCFDEELSGDETSVDAGGSCGGDGGDYCADTSECSAGYKCVENTCTAHPVIIDIDPLSGAPGNWVTVFGKNFGSSPGQVQFGLDTNGDDVYDNTDTAWADASVVQCGNTSSWYDNYTIVQVPDGLASLASSTAIRIWADGQEEMIDYSTDDFGNIPGEDGIFTISDQQRPGLCAVEVDGEQEVIINGVTTTYHNGATAAPPEVGVRLVGAGFTNNVGDVWFGDVKTALSSVHDPAWTDTRIGAVIPANMAAGKVPVRATVNNVNSNALPFDIVSLDGATIGPQIDAISPSSTTRGSYITISGSNFGAARGSIYIAQDANTTCPASVVNCRKLTVELPAQCDDTWRSDEIIAGIPEDETDFPAGSWYVTVERRDGRTIKDSAQIVEIVPGEPRPSICSLDPLRGTAPLSTNANPLTIAGVNFGTAPSVYFYNGGTQQDDSFSGDWLSFGESNLENYTDEEIQTVLPVDGGKSMQSGPIHVQAGSQVSNPVTYQAQDCREAGSLTRQDMSDSGFRCCTAGGLDQGRWVDNTYSCEGEDRDAGYVWRFTTGHIPQKPYIVEQCEKGVVDPSPTPSNQYSDGESVCLNASVQVHFSMPDMNPSTIDDTSVHVYKCGSDSDPDCDYQTEITNLDVDAYSRGDSILTILDNGSGDRLDENTWYRVTLDRSIQSDPSSVNNFTPDPEPLQATRPLTEAPGDVAYYYDFRTGGSDNRCELESVHINPPIKTVNTLGMIPDVYSVWGQSDRECTALSVTAYDWTWASRNTAQATISRRSGTDEKVNVTAKSDAPDGVIIEAATEGEELAPPEIETLDLLQVAGVGGSFQPDPSVGVPVIADANIFDDFGDGFTFQSSFLINTISAAEFPNDETLLRHYLFYKVNEVEMYLEHSRDAATNDVSRRFVIRVMGADGWEEFSLGDTSSLQYNQYNLEIVQDESSDTPVARLTNFSYQPVGEVELFVVDKVAEVSDIYIGGATTTQSYWLGEISLMTLETRTQPEALGLSGSYLATSTLYIELGDPQVISVQPNCVESCVNAEISATFNRDMVVSTYTDAKNSGFITLEECEDATCAQSDTINTFTVTESTPRKLIVNPGGLLEPGRYYKVTINQGADESSNNAIRARESVGGSSFVKGKVVQSYEWTFRTRTDGTLCSVDHVDIAPGHYSARKIGEKAVFRATPISAPNACSAAGQALDATQFGYNWSVADPAVAELTTVPRSLQYNSAYCTERCLPKGSDIARDDSSAEQPLCGNGVVDIGEDCDPADSSSTKECTDTCLFPEKLLNDDDNSDYYAGSMPVAQFDPTQTGQSWCGDGEITQGEACDPGVDPEGCTNTCQHTGTQMTAYWCEQNEDPLTCTDTASVCGNALLEYDEECEVTATNTLAVWQFSKNGDGKIARQLREGTANDAIQFCSNRCTLQNINDEAIQDANHDLNALGALALRGGSTDFLSYRCDPSLQSCRADGVLLGSSAVYADSSACGDRRIGAGEYPGCELYDSDTNDERGPVVVATAVGTRIPTGGEEEVGALETTVSSTLVEHPAAHAGEATFALQCGYGEYENVQSYAGGRVQYNACPNNTQEHPNNYGVGNSSCCLERPQRVESYPIDGAGFGTEQLACPNTAIRVAFNQEIDESTVEDAAVLLRGDTSGSGCLSGEVDRTTEMNHLLQADGAVLPTESQSFLAQVWQAIKRFVLALFGQDVRATTLSAKIPGDTVWCEVTDGLRSTGVQTVSSEENTTSTITLAPQRMLDTLSTYAVVLKGGTNGIRDIRGVGIRSADDEFNLDDSILFKTRAQKCRFDKAVIEPASDLFTAPNATSTFVAHAYHDDNGTLREIVTTTEYSWEWSWGPTQNEIFSIPAAVASATNTISANSVAGEADLFARATITDLSAGSTQNQNEVVGNAHLTALFCENPWPDYNADNTWDPFVNGKYNFSFYYCADAGVSANTSDDLPYLGEVETQEQLPDDTLMKQILFSGTTADVFGLQVLKNPRRLSASKWYQEEFEDAPVPPTISVAGFDAVRDGNAFYVNALNVDKDNDTIWNNIYLFTVNEGAGSQMMNVFEQIMNSLRFNTNLTDYGVCLEDGVVNKDQFESYSDAQIANVSTTTCRTDFQCLTDDGAAKAGTNGVCSAEKSKLFRDWERIQDVERAQTALNTEFATLQSSPGDFNAGLGGGTFINGYTNSKWGSWGLLSNNIEAVLPSDPVNQWVGCNDLEDNNCYENTEYNCPAVAQMYEYEYDPANASYNLYVPFEYFTPATVITDFSSHIPSLGRLKIDERYCEGEVISTASGQCGDSVLNPGEQCDPPGYLTSGNIGDVSENPGTCAYIPSKTCTESAPDCGYAETQEINGGTYHLISQMPGVCLSGDHKYITTDASIIGQNEGTISAVSCFDDADCQDISAYGDGEIKFINPADFSDATNPMSSSSFADYLSTHNVTCDSSGFAAEVMQCELSGETVVIEEDALCPESTTANWSCNTQCEWDYDLCQAPTQDCGNGIIEGGEFCDDGARNGDYGYCAENCEEPAAYCGDGDYDAANEFCDPTDDDFDDYDLTKENSCSWDCQSYGGYCGDGIVQDDENEQCDDGNNVGADGCTATCQNEVTACLDVQPQFAIHNGDTFISLQSFDGLVFDEVKDNLIPAISNGETEGPYYTPQADVGACRDEGITGEQICGSYGLDCAVVSKVDNGSFDNIQSSYAGCDYSLDQLQSSELGNTLAFVQCTGEFVGYPEEAPAVSDSPQCGNGIKETEKTHPNADPQSWEACDLGEQNGVVCDPAYDQSCTYCVSDCSDTKTVDSVAYCGDGEYQEKVPVAERPDDWTDNPGEYVEICDGEKQNVWPYDDAFAKTMFATAYPPAGVWSDFDAELREKLVDLSVKNANGYPSYIEGGYLCANECSVLQDDAMVSCGLRYGDTDRISDPIDPYFTDDPENGSDLVVEWINTIDPTNQLVGWNTPETILPDDVPQYGERLLINYAQSDATIGWSEHDPKVPGEYRFVKAEQVNLHPYCRESNPAIAHTQQQPDYYQFGNPGVVQRDRNARLLLPWEDRYFIQQAEQSSYDLLGVPVLWEGQENADQFRNVLSWYRDNDKIGSDRLLGKVKRIAPTAAGGVDSTDANFNSTVENATNCNQYYMDDMLPLDCYRPLSDDAVVYHADRDFTVTNKSATFASSSDPLLTQRLAYEMASVQYCDNSMSSCVDNGNVKLYAYYVTSPNAARMYNYRLEDIRAELHVPHASSSITFYGDDAWLTEREDYQKIQFGPAKKTFNIRSAAGTTQNATANVWWPYTVAVTNDGRIFVKPENRLVTDASDITAHHLQYIPTEDELEASWENVFTPSS